MTKCNILAVLTQPIFEQFFRDDPSFNQILAEIPLFDPAEPYSSLVEAIHLLEPKILLTGWGSIPLPESFREDCPSVRYICHLTGELRWLLPRSLLEMGLLVTNWGPSISDNVAEGALFLILACLRRATDVVLTMHSRKGWDLKGAPGSLLEKRVGIHGFGNVARQLVLLLKPFRCSISAYSPPVPDEVFAACAVRRETKLERLFEDNDIIVELEALTKTTNASVGLDLLERIRPGGIFVNAGRGKVVRERELQEIARRGEIFIGLDVYEHEPLPRKSRLRGLTNVFLTPHYAGPTPDRYGACARYALANLRAYQDGQPLNNLIGVGEYDRMT
jgi:phosphoglycerate dehydrogenase-like enzyme